MATQSEPCRESMAKRTRYLAYLWMDLMYKYWTVYGNPNLYFSGGSVLVFWGPDGVCLGGGGFPSHRWYGNLPFAFWTHRILWDCQHGAWSAPFAGERLVSTKYLLSFSTRLLFDSTSVICKLFIFCTNTTQTNRAWWHQLGVNDSATSLVLKTCIKG